MRGNGATVSHGGGGDWNQHAQCGLSASLNCSTHTHTDQSEADWWRSNWHQSGPLRKENEGKERLKRLRRENRSLVFTVKAALIFSPFMIVSISQIPSKYIKGSSSPTSKLCNWFQFPPSRRQRDPPCVNHCYLASASNWPNFVAASLGPRVKIKEPEDQSSAELETFYRSCFWVLVLLGSPC